MAEPTQAQINAAAEQFMREISDTNEPCDAAKAAVYAAATATNTWQAANTAAFVAALPAAFRNNTSAAQKARLFDIISALRRRVG